MGIARPLLSAAFGGVLGLAGCAGSSRAPPAPPIATPSADDASLDWRPLLQAPFGTLLKDMPLPLHEVLLFQDEAHAAADTDGKDCYASDHTPPAFLGVAPRVYLFCFTHDHLTRIEAIALLPTDGAALKFAHACALWRKHAAPTATPPADGTCEGQEVGMGWSATSALAADGVTVSFTVFGVSEQAAPGLSPAAGRPAGASPADGGPATPPRP